MMYLYLQACLLFVSLNTMMDGGMYNPLSNEASLVQNPLLPFAMQQIQMQFQSVVQSLTSKDMFDVWTINFFCVRRCKMKSMGQTCRTKENYSIVGDNLNCGEAQSPR